MIDVIVIDDHPAVRDAVAVAVEAEPDMALAGVAGTAADALALVRAGAPDVAVVDIALGDAHGIDLVRGLQAERPHLGIVVFSMYDEAVYADRALRAGALGYVRKSEPTSAVTAAIRTAADGEVYLGERAAGRLSVQADGPSGPPSAGLSTLTDREMAVFQLLGQGRSIDDIAARLNLSRKTVETYRRRSKEKLGLTSVADLLQVAIRWTLVRESPA